MISALRSKTAALEKQLTALSEEELALGEEESRLRAEKLRRGRDEEEAERLRRENEQLKADIEKMATAPDSFWADLTEIQRLRTLLRTAQESAQAVEAEAEVQKKENQELVKELAMTEASMTAINCELSSQEELLGCMEEVLFAAGREEWTADWECTGCTYLNGSEDAVCQVCERDPPPGAQARKKTDVEEEAKRKQVEEERNRALEESRKERAAEVARRKAEEEARKKAADEARRRARKDAKAKEELEAAMMEEQKRRKDDQSKGQEEPLAAGANKSRLSRRGGTWSGDRSYSGI